MLKYIIYMQKNYRKSCIFPNIILINYLCHINLTSLIIIWNSQMSSLPANNQQKPLIFDVSKLSSASLRKYQSYFGISCTDDQLKDKIAYHFDNELKVDLNEVVDKFLELKRQDKEKKGPRQRTTRAPNN